MNLLKLVMLTKYRNLILVFGAILGLSARAISQPYGLTERVPNTSFLLSTSGNNLTTMDVVPAFPNLSFSEPVYLTHAADGSNRLFVVERAGRIEVFENRSDAATTQTFLDIRAKVNADPGEGGMFSVAFHPQYSDNGKFYVNYTTGQTVAEFKSVIAEYRVSADSNVADPASERIILEVNQPWFNHNGGQLQFGPDGYLYVGFGDGGGGGDEFGNSQDRTTLLASLIRIDVDATEGSRQYAIPADNPFTGNAEGWREEIWAWGLRNPWRFSFDRETSVLWCADVGEDTWEEVNIIEKGRNYGWNIMEGLHCFNPDTLCDTTGLALPIVEYNHSEGFSITGGYVYRNPRLKRLQGVYVYGDFVTRTIWGLKYDNGQILENSIIAASPAAITSFGEDESGEVYVVGFDGRIYRFEEKDGSEPPGFIPQTISGSGLYEDMTARSVAPGVIPYSVNSPLWSDGAYKERFLALPETTKIVFSKDGFWEFPPNAILVKNFYLELQKGDPQSRKLVETRFLVRRYSQNEWDGFSYMWNDSTSDATLLEGSATRMFTIADTSAPGGSFDYEYYFPSREDCRACHTAAAGFVLGLKTAQMNKNHNYDGVADNQLRSYNHIRVFTENIGEDYAGFPKLPVPADTSADLEARARSYLDANCSQCHRPGGTGRANMDFRFSTATDSMHLIDATPLFGDLGVAEAKRLSPGAPDSSVLYLRTVAVDENRMPPLATSLVDEAGTRLLSDWIVSLAPADTSTQDTTGTDTTVAESEIDTLWVDGLARTFKVYVPATYNPVDSLPLVIVLHGGFGSAATIEEVTGFSVKADSANFFVLYPEGLPGSFGIRTWNAGGCCGFAAENDVDDVGFVETLLDTLSRRLKIDGKRVYATGISNGGMMAYRLACELSQRIAAVAPVAATMAVTTCEPDRPVPILHLHSYLDENVPVEGGVGVGVSGFNNPPLDSVLTAWSQLNGCQTAADTVYSGVDFDHVIWRNCQNDAEIELYLTHDGGHSWPGGNMEGSSRVIEGTELIWDFFARQELKTPPQPTNVLTPATVKTFVLQQNYPNPFNPATTIAYRIPEKTVVRITIFDVMGRKVKTLFDGEQPAGAYSLRWDASNDSGMRVSSGVYFYRIQAGKFVQTRKLLLLK